MAMLLVLSLSLALRPQPRKLTQADIHAAVLKTLETAQLPSAVAKAYDTIRPSVVRVTGYGKSKNGKEDEEYGVGTGVVIVDKGIILTNLHVVQGAQTIKVVFSDGLESTAHITGAQPENDLAVLQAHKIPDDMIAATMRSTGDLAPGDHVLAVGYPFGIGPSASAGVISGLKRTFRSPEGKQEMSNLIQFDAAANPGKFSPATRIKFLKLIEKEARLVTSEDEAACLAMGEFGARLLPRNCVIMTHCNAGALATMGIGTAVGVITAAHKKGKIKHAYSCETRPYLQGARLTIWELMREGVPSELLTDNMAAHIIKTCGVNAIVVGADRIASNGDTANKIGTYGLAVIAKHHKVPFYVAAPTPTIDMKAKDGDAIVIEERSSEEVTFVKGRRIAPKKVRVRHPAFDITPAGLITALITERGVIKPVSRAAVKNHLK